MGTEEELQKKYDLIPEGIDILISHTPPYGILDKNYKGMHCGSVSLRNIMHRVDPQYLICGHIHECGGKEINLILTKVINCSLVNERYNPVHRSIRIITN
jgi:Icc-related predicted phosphoesterase